MTHLPVTTGRQTLSKLGAHLRWLIEKSEIDPENAVVAIQVNNIHDQSLLLSTILQEFDSSTMARFDNQPHMVVVHGVPIWVTVYKPKAPA